MTWLKAFIFLQIWCWAVPDQTDMKAVYLTYQMLNLFDRWMPLSAANVCFNLRTVRIFIMQSNNKSDHSIIKKDTWCLTKALAEKLHWQVHDVKKSKGIANYGIITVTTIHMMLHWFWGRCLMLVKLTWMLYIKMICSSSQQNIAKPEPVT